MPRVAIPRVDVRPDRDRLARRGFAAAAVLAALTGTRATAFAPPPGLSPLAADLLGTLVAGKLAAAVLVSSLVPSPWSLVLSADAGPPAAHPVPTKDQGPRTSSATRCRPGRSHGWGRCGSSTSESCATWSSRPTAS